jgi:hypothetical protein
MRDPWGSMTSVAPKTGDTPSLPDEDEAEMTSIMSADQRKALQQAASNSKEAETLERETAKPPPPAQAAAEDVEAIKIPKAPALPGAARASKASPAAPAAKAPSRIAAPAASSGWTTWELVPFVLLAVAVAVALRM